MYDSLTRPCWSNRNGRVSASCREPPGYFPVPSLSGDGIISFRPFIVPVSVPVDDAEASQAYLKAISAGFCPGAKEGEVIALLYTPTAYLRKIASQPRNAIQDDRAKYLSNICTRTKSNKSYHPNPTPAMQIKSKSCSQDKETQKSHQRGEH